MQEEIANVSANIPGTGVTPAGKPAGFGDPIVNPGAAKRWKAINKTSAGGILRRKKPNLVAEEDQIDEMDISRMSASKNIEDRRSGLNPISIANKFTQRMQDRQSGSAREQTRHGKYIPAQTPPQSAIGAAADAAKDIVGSIQDRMGTGLGKSSGKPANVSNLQKSSPTAASIPTVGGSSSSGALTPDSSERTPKGHQTVTSTPTQQRQVVTPRGSEDGSIEDIINRIDKDVKTKTPSKMNEETFAGAVVFEVSSHTFHNAKMEKRKGKHWRTYLDECDELTEIREYANKNPNKPIVLQNRNTNEMVYVKYGKAR